MQYTLDKNNTGIVIVDCTNKDNRLDKGSIRTNTLRTLGPFALHETCDKHNVKSTVINYLDFWTVEELLDYVSTWMQKVNVSKLVVAASNTFDVNFLALDKGNKGIVANIKALIDTYDAYFIVGGPFPLTEPKQGVVVPQEIFYGRSLTLFKSWLDGEESKYSSWYKGVIKHHDDSRQVNDDPVVPKLYDDYCLMSTDVLPFEIRVGCKFNCTFCAYEFRNAKEINDTSEHILLNFLQTAKTKYGITHFTLADDTPNEDTKKLETLLSAVKQLDYQPLMSGFIRLDVLINQPHQIPMVDEIGFHGHYYGLESLHPVAQKNIRKTIKKEKVFDYLRLLRQEYPHWAISLGYIIGLPGEPFEYTQEVFDYITENDLLDHASTYPLWMQENTAIESNKSEMTTNPEKFGIRITERLPTGQLVWETDTGTFYEANRFSNKLNYNLQRKHGTINLDGWEIIQRKALGESNYFDPNNRKQLKKQIVAVEQQGKNSQRELVYNQRWNDIANNHVYKYIELKKEYINSL